VVRSAVREENISVALRGATERGSSAADTIARATHIRTNSAMSDSASSAVSDQFFRCLAHSQCRAAKCAIHAEPVPRHRYLLFGRFHNPLALIGQRCLDLRLILFASASTSRRISGSPRRSRELLLTALNRPSLPHSPSARPRSPLSSPSADAVFRQEAVSGTTMASPMIRIEHFIISAVVSMERCNVFAVHLTTGPSRRNAWLSRSSPTGPEDVPIHPMRQNSASRSFRPELRGRLLGRYAQGRGNSAIRVAAIKNPKSRTVTRE